MTRQTDHHVRDTRVMRHQHRLDHMHHDHARHEQMRRRAGRRSRARDHERAREPRSWLGLLYRTLNSWAMCSRLLLMVVVLISVIVGGLYLLRVELGPFLITRG